MLKPGKNHNTSRFFYCLILIGSVFFLLTGCEDEKAVPREYPRINTLPVVNITDEGATFSADLFSEGNEAIVEYGFVWGVHEPRLGVNDKIVLDLPVKAGIYTADVRSALIKNEDYFVKPYIKTINHTVYGKTVKFISNGSLPPVITGFQPDSAGWMDTLKISGKNFSWVASQNKVKLNAVECDVISCSDTTLYVKVSPSVKTIQNSVSVELAGNISFYTKDLFNLIPPAFLDFYPKQAGWGDTIYIRGKYLRNASLYSGDYIKAGTFSCGVLNPRSDTLLAVQIPYELNTVENNISIKINGFLLSGKQPLILSLHSDFSFSFSPSEATWGSTIILKGKFHPVASRNTFYFNSVQATVNSSSSGTVSLTVPYSLSGAKSNIIYKVAPFSIVSADTFRLSAPEILSFSPVSSSSGEYITITGKNLMVTKPVVKFGNVTVPSQNVTFYNPTTVIVLVPPLSNGPVKISVICNSLQAISSADFIVTNPLITSVFPLSGTFNDEITINGAYLVQSGKITNVYFGNKYATIKSSSATSIVVKVPFGIDSIPKIITVTSGSNNALSTELFTLLPHQINSLSPLVIFPGQDLTISGSGFNPDYTLNEVSWAGLTLIVKSSTSTQIVATWPQYLPRNNVGIKVTTGGYSRISAQKLSYVSQWLSIPSPILSSHSSGSSIYDGMTIYGEATASSGYLCSPGSGIMYKFNPIDNSFSKLNITIPFYLNVKAGEVVCNGSFFLIGGYKYSGWSSMHRFDESLNAWIEISPFPFTSRTGVGFSLNNKIYYGLNYFNNFSKEMWECDPANNYLWTRKTDMPVLVSLPYTTYFSLDNKGYVLYTDNTFWQFDPVLNSWIKKSDFPGPARRLAVSFVLGNYAYMGTGASGTVSYDDIWRYDSSNDTWTLISHIPEARNSSVAFTLNNKAYIGYGWRSGYKIFTDFYEFDPNYPSK